ncbi:hypothetical protein DFH11DRAFT_1621986 [Phellopilus nigrolimitatus]|nr:hypothetical protein DFH11DRAFT_1621986 [Phellopilus nigrolimitatus]
MHHDADETVSTLPQSTLELIDRAFDRAVLEAECEMPQRPLKRRRTGQSAVEREAGGFVYDNSEDAGAGFIAEDSNEHNGFDQITHIHLSLIPRALQLLDLPPDDAEILDVFTNAASGWHTTSDQFEAMPGIHEEVVDRKDWRAVCAALLPASLRQQESSRGEQPRSDSPAAHSIAYGSDSSEDEYFPSPRNRSRGSRRSVADPHSRKSLLKKPSGVSDTNMDGSVGLSSLTARQENEARTAFALFFPDTPKDARGETDFKQLAKMHLSIKDVARAAASIKEKITAEEIVEMLTFFSSSSSHNHPTLTLADFQEMIVVSKLA